MLQQLPAWWGWQNAGQKKKKKNQAAVAGGRSVARPSTVRRPRTSSVVSSSRSRRKCSEGKAEAERRLRAVTAAARFAEAVPGDASSSPPDGALDGDQDVSSRQTLSGSGRANSGIAAPLRLRMRRGSRRTDGRREDEENERPAGGVKCKYIGGKLKIIGSRLIFVIQIRD